MDIGTTIRKLRNIRGIKQETFAADIGVSVQTVSCWENDVNYPDISMLPIIASYFKVTTDYLLGVKGEISMAKLIKTVETFELPAKSDADRMLADFKTASFPKVVSSNIYTREGKVFLEVTKEFGVELETMQFN